MRAVNLGDAVRIPVDQRMAALIPFRSQGSYRYVSATDVIRGTLGADLTRGRDEREQSLGGGISVEGVHVVVEDDRSRRSERPTRRPA